MSLSFRSEDPDFNLVQLHTGQTVGSGSFTGKKLILMFIPGELPDEMLTRLGDYQNNLPAFAEAGAGLVVFTTSAENKASSMQSLTILLDPSGDTMKAYRVLDDGGQILPTVYVVGEDGVVKVSYDAERFPNLPGAPVVARAVRRLALAPTPGEIRSDDWVQGSPQAPIVFIEYSDYQCPHCMESHEALEEILPLLPAR